MKNLKLILILVTAVIMMGLVACGGGGSSNTTSVTGSTNVGVVTGFGSVFINGIEYETGNSEIEIEDETGKTEGDLNVGDVVVVKGTINTNGTTGTATSITTADEIEGVVVDVSGMSADGTGIMNIMGQQVTITAMTVFESDVAGIVSIADVNINNIVEVSGFSAGKGDILATRLEVKALDLSGYLTTHSEGVELKGLIANLDEPAKTFSIGSMVIDYSAVTLGSLNLTEDLYVEVKSVSGIDIVSGQLVASMIEIEDDGIVGYQGEESEDFEINGVLTSVLGVDNTFVINNQTIIIDANTEYQDRITLADLSDVANVGKLYIEVEGVFNSNKQLVAKDIDIEESVEDEYKGTLSNITATDVNSGTITMTLTVAKGANPIGSEITIMVNNKTMMKDDSTDVATGYFNLTNWASGNYSGDYIGDIVEVDTYTESTTSDLVALKIEKEDN